jgi:hypothetical protein
MTANSGPAYSLEVSAFIPFQTLCDGALPGQNMDAGRCKRLNGVRPDMTRNYSVHVLIHYSLSSLDAGTASEASAPILQNRKAHVRRIYDQKAGATAESWIECGIQTIT